MQVFGERFCESIGQGFDEYGGVVVVFRFVAPDELIGAMAGGHCERSDVVDSARLDRCNEIR